MIRKLAVLFLFPLLLGGTGAGQVSQSSQAVIIEGSTQSVEGSPVMLSGAKFSLLKQAGKFKLVSEAVNIRNTSGRSIRRLKLRFIHNHLSRSGDICRGNNGVIAVDGLAAGETREWVHSSYKLTWYAKENDLTLTVQATGAEFEDGTHWAGSRSQLCTLISKCLHTRSQLMIRECSLNDAPYKVLLEVTDPKIVAYRLGIVRDTPDSFEVKIGRSIELLEQQKAYRARFVDAGDSISSEMFRSLAFGGADVQWELPVNFAIFVAELQFVDGRVWRQDTHRDSLLWDNY